MADREKLIRSLERYLVEGRRPRMQDIRDAIDLLKAQPPKHIHEEFPSHDWILDEDGEIDLFAMDCDFHNGPSCKRCGYSFCMHCNPDGFTKEPCVIDKNVCPTCGRFIFTGQNYCSFCGQAVKWE